MTRTLYDLEVEKRGIEKGKRKKIIKIFDKKLEKMSLDEIINFLELDKEESTFIRDYYRNKKQLIK